MLDADALREHLGLTSRDLVWQFTTPALVHDHHTLAQLGPGKLSIDLVTGKCRHQNRDIAPLVITGILTLWLRESLVKVGLPKTGAEEARLDATLEFEPFQAPREARDPSGPPLSSVRCRAAVSVRLVVQGISVTARGEDSLEWYA